MKPEKLLLFIIIHVCMYFIFVRLPEFSSRFYQPSSFVYRMDFLGADFINTYAAAQAVRNKLNPYRNNSHLGQPYTDPLSGGEWSRYTFGPLLAYFYLLFTVIAFETAYRIWFILCIVIALFSIILLARLTGFQIIFIQLLLIYFFLSYPLLFALERGTSDFLMLFLISLSFYGFYRKKSDWIIAFCLSAAIFSKFYPGILLFYFIARRQWKIVAKTLTVLLTLFIILFDFQIYKSAYFLMRYTSLYPPVWSANHSIVSFFRFIGLPEDMSSLSAIVFTFILVISSLIVIWNKKSFTSSDTFLSFGIMTVLMDVIPPVSNDYKIILEIITAVALLYTFLFLKMDLKHKILSIITMILLSFLMIPTSGVFHQRLLLNKFPALIILWLILMYLFISNKNLYKIKREYNFIK